VGNASTRMQCGCYRYACKSAPRVGNAEGLGRKGTYKPANQKRKAMRNVGGAVYVFVESVSSIAQPINKHTHKPSSPPKITPHCSMQAGCRTHTPPAPTDCPHLASQLANGMHRNVKHRPKIRSALCCQRSLPPPIQSLVKNAAAIFALCIPLTNPTERSILRLKVRSGPHPRRCRQSYRLTVTAHT
jgi:hypothetical protein